MDYDKKVSEKYDKYLALALNPIRKYLVKVIKKYEIKSVLDFCCGTGNQLKFLLKSDIKDVIGVDLSENMIAQTQVGEYNPKCLLEDATKTSFDDHKFDMGMVSFALHEKSIDVAKGIIEEAKRVVKKGGYFAVVDYCFDKKSYFPGRWGSIVIEKMAGGEHYANFNTYIAKGGLNYLFENQKIIEEKSFLFGAVRMRLFQF